MAAALRVWLRSIPSHWTNAFGMYGEVETMNADTAESMFLMILFYGGPGFICLRFDRLKPLTNDTQNMATTKVEVNALVFLSTARIIARMTPL